MNKVKVLTVYGEIKSGVVLSQKGRIYAVKVGQKINKYHNSRVFPVGG